MNKRIAALSMVVVSLSISVAAMASTIKYDYDREVDFSKWQSMAWKVSNGPDLTIAERRIAKAIEVGFAGRGYTLIEEKEKADFLIDYHAAAWQDVRVDAMYRGPGFGRYVRVDREPMGSLVVVVIDRKTGKLAWRGTVSDALANDPEQADKKLAKAITKLLSKFPARKVEP